MYALRRSLNGASFACLIALASACGDDDKRAETQTSDSAVGAAPDPQLLPDANIGLPPTTPTMPPTAVGPDGAGGLDAGLASIDAGAEPPVAMQPDASPTTPHPLSGRYAVRTVSYARQKTEVAGQMVDLVSKAVLLSVADVSPAGLVNEHLCLLELYNDEGLATWSAPSGTEKVPDSMVLLERRGEVFVRPREEDVTAVSWSNANRPADCGADGGVHATGCTCVAGDALPTLPTDCRVRDLDGDNIPGLKLSVGGMRPVDPNMGDALFTLQVAAVKAVEWRLPSTPSTMADARVVGTVAGNVDQAQLSVQGELAGQLGQVKNATCPSDTGHVELVRGDFDCAKLLAARRTNIDSYGVFDVGLDARRPEPSACPDPDCTTDTDRDGTMDCMDKCVADPMKVAEGACGCGKADTDANQNGTPDCNDVVDMCPSDPAKTAPGRCGCGVADTDGDADGTPDCADGCASDPAKTAAGSCGCGVAETNGDNDGAPDCTDECDSDPNKTAAGTCGCGTPETDSDSDGTPDCRDECDADPRKTAPGICNCGVADADLDGNGTVDCSDACPQDPAKVAPGLCGCGVADTNTDGDAEPDCDDACPNNPALTAQGACGCEACPANPLLGTYAVRTVIFGKSRIGTGTTSATTSKAISYALVNVTAGANGSVTMTERTCAAETIPQQTNGAYGWSRPDLAQAIPPTVRTVAAGTGDTWTATSARGQLGWSPAQQPPTCTGSGTASSPSAWPSSWGSTCTCNEPATSLPPYDRDLAPYDCRLVDADGDGNPGISLYASTSAPPAGFGPPSGLIWATVFAASEGSSRWTITPASDGRHRGTIAEDSSNAIVGCTGNACRGLEDAPPRSSTCPAAVNKVQFVPATAASDTCLEIIGSRASLFVTNEDGPWPDNATCPAP